MREALNLGFVCSENDACLFALALQHGKDWIGSWPSGKGKSYVQPLRACGGKAPALDWNDGMAVNGGEFALKLAHIDVVSAHRRAIDNPKRYRSARFDLYNFWIREGARIGQKSVVFDITQVRLTW
jgi:hypothetical protein